MAVEDGEGVGSHVGERVRVSVEVDDAGAAGVAMIEADDLTAAVDQGLDQFVGPADPLGRGTHDEEDHRVAGITETLGPDLRAVRIDKSLIAIQHEARLMCVSIFIKCRLARPIQQFDGIISEEARVEIGWRRPLVWVTVDGMRAEDGEDLLAGYVSGPAAATEATALGLVRAKDGAVVALVEGVSDQIAVETLARRYGPGQFLGRSRRNSAGPSWAAWWSSSCSSGFV